MMSHWILLLFVLLPILVAGTKREKHLNNNMTLPVIPARNSIYYDINSKIPLKIETNEIEKLPSNGNKFISKGIPCSCTNLTCGCCAGINMNSFNFTSRACTNVTFLPEELSIDFRILVNDKEMLKNRLSARNPPPVCVPLYALPIITFCVKFYDIRLNDAKLNTCVDFETKIAQLPVFVLHFDCVRVGAGEVVWTKPEIGNMTVQPAVAEIDAYDEVYFEPDDYVVSNTTNELTPEEEDQIGSLKL